jgi:HSP20 family protein
MAITDLIPWRRSDRSQVPNTGGQNPFLTLHREMNRLFDDMFDQFELMPSVFGRGVAMWPVVEAIPSDNELKVVAELPGMGPKDIEVFVRDDTLTIRGEKKHETESTDTWISERFYGRFERNIKLPFPIDEDKADASFENGVLTLTLPKSAAAEEKVKRIAINSRGRGKKEDLAA